MKDRKTAMHNISEIVPASAMAVADDWFKFMQETVPDALWCTDPENHYHERAVVEEVQAVIAGADYK